MITTTRCLTLIRQHYDPDTRYLFRILLNATSIVEASIALDLLLKSVPERPLVAAVNLREVLKSLPASPFPMAVDEQTLVRVAGLEKSLSVLGKRTPDGYDVVVTTAGNLVLDLIVKKDDVKYFWTPIPVTSDFVAPALIEPIVSSDHLLESVIDLVVAMGVVFNPTLYLSLEDWRLEHATETMEGLSDLF